MEISIWNSFITLGRLKAVCSLSQPFTLTIVSGFVIVESPIGKMIMAYCIIQTMGI